MADPVNKLTKTTQTLMFAAFHQYRTLDILPYIEESLTGPQARLLRRFLTWCEETGTTFGVRNFDQVFARFQEATKAGGEGRRNSPSLGAETPSP